MLPEAEIIPNFWQFITQSRANGSKFSEPGSKCLYTGILFIEIKDLGFRHFQRDLCLDRKRFH